MPRIDLGKTAVLSSEEQEQFKTAQEIIDEIEDQVASKGLAKYPRPAGEPADLTQLDITTMSNNELGQHFIRYTAFAQYVFGDLANIQASYRIGIASLKLIEANLKSKLFAREVAKAEIPAMVREDPIRVEYELEVLRLFAMKEILEARYKAYQRSADALSRIIEIRKLDFDQSMRDSSIGGHRKRPAQRPSAGDFSRGGT